MQNTPVKLLDVVALSGDKPEEGLVAGQVGTVVAVFLTGSPSAARRTRLADFVISIAPAFLYQFRPTER